MSVHPEIGEQTPSPVEQFMSVRGGIAR